jgi:hypothetical protein
MKNFYVLLFIGCLLITHTGCVNPELQQENKKLQATIEVLKQENVQLLIKLEEYKSQSSQPLSMLFLEKQHNQRYIPKELPLLLFPQEGSSVLNLVQAHSVVTVNDFVDVYGEIWLHVTIPVFDSPMNMKGWIKEEDTELYTAEKKDDVMSPIHVPVDTPIYNVDLSGAITKVENETTQFEKYCFISDDQGEYVALGCAGGESIIVEKSEIRYP